MIGIEIKTTEIKAINNELATFNCEGQVSGIIHSSKDGIYTVVLDGGYKLDMTRCPHCSIEAIQNLADKLSESEKAFGMNYPSYKEIFLSGVNSSSH